jgi:hypothetical protein
MDRANKFRNWGIVVFILFLLELFFNFQHHFSARSLALYLYPEKIVVSILDSPLLMFSMYLILKSNEIQRSVLNTNRVQRSAGVTLFAIYMMLGIVKGALVCHSFYNSLSIGMRIFTVISMPVSIILGFNIFKLKEWARKGFVFYCAITVLISPLLFTKYILKEKLKGASPIFSISITYFIISALVFLPVFFITRPKIKAQFK